MRRRILVLLFALTLALTGCSSNSTPPESGTSGSSAADAGSTRLTAAAVEALLEGDLASESWASSVTGVAETTYLRRPVVSIGFKDSATAQTGSMALQTALAGSDAWGVLELLDPVMTSFVQVGSSQSIEATELPATPASAVEFASWLDTAFGVGSPAPEDWVAHVQSTEYVPSLPSGFSEVLVVRTDLPFDHEGKRTAQVIVQAIHTAAPTFATQYAVYFADGNNITAGAITPGIAAFGY